jgi:hypothetical protein
LVVPPEPVVPIFLIFPSFGRVPVVGLTLNPLKVISAGLVEEAVVTVNVISVEVLLVKEIARFVLPPNAGATEAEGLAPPVSHSNPVGALNTKVPPEVYSPIKLS